MKNRLRVALLFGGKSAEHEISLISARHIYQAIDHAKYQVLPIAIDRSAIRQIPEAPFQEAQRAVDLSQAARIVAVGRGIKSQEHLPLAESLAKALGAELAASRPICDSGWLPMERQVGSSGQTVAPKLYMALGISGAIQHLVGMKGSRTVVAINKDPDAPIFEVADYGIVGDLFEIVPAIVAELQNICSWVSTAPLGKPVVPEVYMSRSGSSGPPASGGSLSGAPPVRSA